FPSPSGGRRCLQSVPTRRSSDLLIHAEPGRETDQNSSKDSSKKSRNQESEDVSDENSGPHLCSNPNVVELVYRASRTYLGGDGRSEEHTSELQSRSDLVCRLLLE